MTTTSTQPTPVSSLALLGLTSGDMARIGAAIEAELAESTRTSYLLAWRHWEAWCRGRGIGALPTVPESLAAFLAERAESGLCFGTLDGACSAIAHRHQQEGLPDPTADVLVRRVRRGLRRIMGTAPHRQAHPLTVDELVGIVSIIDPGTAIGARDRAVILLGYASVLSDGAATRRTLCSRPGRHRSQAHRHPRGRTPLQDRPRRPRAVRRSRPRPAPYDRSHPCARGLAQDPTQRTGRALHPRLSIGTATTERIGPRAVSRLVQARAIEAGFEGVPVTGHSLRAGHATTAAVNGAPIDRIAAQTGHRDLGTLFNHYIRPAEALATATSGDLGL